MLGSMQIKLAAALMLLLGMIGVGFWSHHAGVVAGRAEVQARWDAAKAQQAALVTKAMADNAKHVADLEHQFDALSARYEVATHAIPPAVADSVADGLAAGAVRLRDAAPATCAGAVPAATARARAADAAATQALADRTAAAIAAVRAGDAADARERQLREQVTALQGVLRAERGD